MTAAMKTIIYPVTDLATAKALFGALLAAQPVMDEAYYVQFDIDGMAVGLDPHGHRSGPVNYWDVEDIQAAVSALVDAGATVAQEVKDVGGGKLVATVTDADGNVIGVAQPA